MAEITIEEVKEEVKAKIKAEATEATEVSNVPDVHVKLSPQEEHKGLQSKKATAKKKIKNYTSDELRREMGRMERTNQQLSSYYQQLKGRVKEIAHKIA